MPRRATRLRNLPTPSTPPAPPMARSATPPPQQAAPPPIPEEAAPPDDAPPTAVAEVVDTTPDPVALEKARLTQASRDALGFSTDALPHITAEQLRWLTYRLESGDDRTACDRSDTDPYNVLVWMADPGFRATYEAALDNKREGFKTLTSHLIPATIRALQQMLDSGNPKHQKEAATLVMRAQGLLVDKQQTADPAALSALFSLLREERPIEARILPTRPQLPAGES